MTTENMARKPPESQLILIVEDSPDDFDAAKRAFTAANLRNPLKHVSSGEAAVEYLRAVDSPRPSLILLDLNMPGLDGRRVLRIIKQSAELKDIPVVVLTTSDDDRDVSACYEAGANTYIQKPVDFDGLIGAIRQLKEYWFEIALLPKESAS
jgi:two-component system response regulator